MSPTIQSAFGNFVGSLTATGASLVNAFIALFTAIFAFGQSILSTIVQFVQSIVHLGLDLFQGITGFVFANFFVIAILGGGYYWWSTRAQ
ncbi:hypothetical protein FA95DRAFT_1474877, partial [Auriscalpium vulgare]